MIELERHIEILLLSNDCVIVPGLGGFMTHHVEARYDERDSMFLPPLRTLGFNPQLNINDSLLVQSYIEAYDISYPEALQRIDDEVNELRQHVENEGSYELNDIGVLSLNEDGNYVFTPCEAGILTPSLYGLSSFEAARLQARTAHHQTVASPKPEPDEAKVIPIIGIDKETVNTKTVDTEATDTDIEEEDDDVVRIKYAWIRNAVAVAAILLAIFFLAMPTGKTDMMQRTISNINNGLLFGMMSEDTNMSKIEIQKVIRGHEGTEVREHENSLSPDTCSNTDSIAKGNLVPSASERLSPAPPHPQITPQKQYCIVLASYVSMRNANAFIERLQKQGYDRAEIFERNNIRRVIYGHYASENDAYNDLHRFHRHSETAEAWVMPL